MAVTRNAGALHEASKTGQEPAGEMFAFMVSSHSKRVEIGHTRQEISDPNTRVWTGPILKEGLVPFTTLVIKGTLPYSVGAQGQNIH